MTAALAQREEDDQVVRESRAVLGHHARSFRWGALFLDERMNRDAAVVYAYCRAVDDAVDEAPSTRIGQARLNNIEDMLEGRVARSPLVAAYVEVAERTGFGLGPARDLIRGARSDLGLVCVESDTELLRYCYRVAGTVGLMMCGVLGVRSADARRHAIDLGIGMQLTNICRDVLEDARMGRVYLPHQRLRAHGARPSELLRVADQEASPTLRSAVAAVVGELLAAAEHGYQSGQLGLHHIPTRPRLSIMVASALYRGIGWRLRRVGRCDPLRGRTTVPWVEKCVLSLGALGRWCKSILSPRKRASAGTPARLPHCHTANP